jgi:hypothetical protein
LPKRRQRIDYVWLPLQNRMPVPTPHTPEIPPPLPPPPLQNTPHPLSAVPSSTHATQSRN